MRDILELFKLIVEDDVQRIHIIDMDTFEVLYSNKASTQCGVLESGWKGEKCYKFFFGRDERCKECPLKNDCIDSSFTIEKENGKKVESVHTNIYDWDGRRLYVEYVQDITEIRNADLAGKRNLELIGALSGDYINIFLIDPGTGESKIVKMNGYVTRGFNKLDDGIYDYKTMCSRYINDRVYSEDVSLMTNVMDINNVIKELGDKSVYVGKYRVIDNGEIHYYQYKYIKVDDTDMIVAGFSNIDKVVEEENRHASELKKKDDELLQSKSDRDRQFEILKSMSDIYYSMHYIDLKSNTTIEYSSSEILKPYVNRTTDASGQLYDAMRHRTSEEFLDRILEFVNLDTLAQRLKGKKIITQDFINVDNIWLRASFISIDTDDDGIAESVIYTTQVIDEDRRREELLFLNSLTDELTGFFNRRAYENDAIAIREKGIPSKFVLVAFDLNGLKHVNDSMGHASGDELIIGATNCIRMCFKPYGKIYRTGGDEFMAILSATGDEMTRIMADFEDTMKHWKGETVSSLSVSVGYVLGEENEKATFDELEKIADRRMYDSKDLYYKTNKIDRRRNRQ